MKIIDYTLRCAECGKMGGGRYSLSSANANFSPSFASCLAPPRRLITGYFRSGTLSQPVVQFLEDTTVATLPEKLGISEELYSVTIPIGATVNMAGAAITITVLTMAAANTLGIEASLGTSLLLCVIAALSACGASGVPSGSLLLVPLACSLFGISYDVAMQVVAVGFIISVIQDSTETALNSSTDVVYTYTVDQLGRD